MQNPASNQNNSHELLLSILQLPTSLAPGEQRPHVSFEFEAFCSKNLGLNLEKMKHVEICQYYLKNQCRMGSRCAYKHPSKTKLVGEMCEFLHEYNLKKMPECWFYTKLGECTNPECQYLHIDPDAKVKECAWYARGFCKHGSVAGRLTPGSECRHKHTRTAICFNYLTGFCPKGKNCSFSHPRYELPTSNALDDVVAQNTEEAQRQAQYQQQAGRGPSQGGYQKRDFSEVTCYKCKEIGHYANQCPNGTRFGA
ncbi:Cleavage and polyadenylation specificity factor subunit 4 [Kappamyces sp. JEL0680]|nr:Cleavage and polyadenylation specificity factor subunit 4 [Kappamyces sp. JEL0680]